MKKEKGSITIFSLLALLLVTAALFALLEGSRFQEMRRFALLQTESALESTFANYNRCLWEQYRLLGADSNSMYEILERNANGRVGKGTNFLRLETKEVQIEEDTRLTDGNGNVYIASVASYMKENFVYEAAKEVYSQYLAIKSILEASPMDKTSVKDALEEIEKLGESNLLKKMTRSTDVKGILETAKYWMEIGVLDLVVMDIDELSHAKEDSQGGVLDRILEKGQNPAKYTITWTERMLLQQYLLTYMSCFTNKKENHAFSYELEYLVGKRHSDIENLKITVTKLLAIREMVNYLYLISDSVRVSQAEAMALLFVGGTGNPMLIEAVKIGLLTAWAFGESILDVRALLEGKKISILKNKENWTLELEQIHMLSDKNFMAKESVWGLGYEDYVGILLLFEEEQVLAMHTMNLQEKTIRNLSENQFFCMDEISVRAKTQIKYSYKPIFPFLRVIDAEQRWEYAVGAEAEYGYY